MPVPTVTLPEFIAKWSASTRTERAAAQEHFIDLCRLLGQPTPNEADPTGDFYAFEKGAVLDAFGWPHDLPDEEILARLLALNLDREAA